MFPYRIRGRCSGRSSSACPSRQSSFRTNRVDGSARRKGFIDSSAEGVVFEADGAAGAGQSDAGQAILEVPRILRCAGRVGFCERVAVVVVGEGGGGVRTHLVGSVV